MEAAAGVGLEIILSESYRKLGLVKPPLRRFLFIEGWRWGSLNVRRKKTYILFALCNYFLVPFPPVGVGEQKSNVTATSQLRDRSIADASGASQMMTRGGGCGELAALES